MSNFIDTTNITDEKELIEALKSNVRTASSVRKEISKLKNAILSDSEALEENKEQCIICDDSDEEDEDLEYEYYYEPIKAISMDEESEKITEIIEQSLPNKNNSNYFNIVNRIKAEIFKEILVYSSMLDETSDLEFIEEVKSCINFEKLKLSLVKNCENSQKIDSTNETKNNIVFFNKNSDRTYAMDDIKNINSEYYESFLELLESIEDGSFKNIRRLTTANNKINSISEVKGFKTRVIFDKVGNNTFVILQLAVKKSDFDKGYRESLTNRISIYRCFKHSIVEDVKNDKHLEENASILKEIKNKLSQNKKKVLTNE